MKLLKSFFYERRVIYGMYFFFWVLIYLTFYLYEYNFGPFWDSWLFTMFLLIVYSIVSFYRAFRKQKKLELLATKDLQLSNLIFLPKADTLSEKTIKRCCVWCLKRRTSSKTSCNKIKRTCWMISDFGYIKSKHRSLP